MLLDAILLALRELRRNLMRAILTTLGIVIGVAAVIAMVTLGNGATASITSSIGSLGQNVLTLRPGTQQGAGGVSTSAKSFTRADVEAIRRDISNLRAVAPQVQANALAVVGNQNHSTSITGSDNNFFIARDWPVVAGREFTDAEISSGKAVCVIGDSVRTKLYGVQNPLGSEIRIGQIPCTVIGLLKAKGQSTFGQDQDDLVIMPLSAVQRRLLGNTDISSIWLSGNRKEDMSGISSDLTTLMRERRRLATGEKDDFQVQDMAQIAQVLQQTTGTLTIFLAAIGAISLLVGGIGIMNIMLVSVTERTREIGIRLAIGAREGDVMMQFLVEAVMMSAFGGILGIVLGLGLSAIGTAILKFAFVPSFTMAAIAVVFSAAMGVGFGYFPARRAARLDPIEALRHE
jgi:putative ABC transport system permease protein